MQINQKPPMFIDASKKIFEKAKLLRHNMTEPEKNLWNILKLYRHKGFKFRRQHPIHDFVADFYCHKIKLIIEIDGKNHNYAYIRDSDNERTRILEENGIKVIRFTNEQVLTGMSDVLRIINQEIGIGSNLLNPYIP